MHLKTLSRGDEKQPHENRKHKRKCKQENADRKQENSLHSYYEEEEEEEESRLIVIHVLHHRRAARTRMIRDRGD